MQYPEDTGSASLLNSEYQPKQNIPQVILAKPNARPPRGMPDPGYSGNQQKKSNNTVSLHQNNNLAFPDILPRLTQHPWPANATFVLTDALGRVVLRRELTPNQPLYSLPTTSFSNGIYYFSIQTPACTLRQGKIIIQK